MPRQSVQECSRRVRRADGNPVERRLVTWPASCTIPDNTNAFGLKVFTRRPRTTSLSANRRRRVMSLRASIYVTLARTLPTVPLAAQGRGKGHVAATPVIHAKPQSAAKVGTHPATPAPKSAVAPRTPSGAKPPKPAKPAQPAAATGKGAQPHPHRES